MLRLATLDADLDASLAMLRADLGTDRCRVAASRRVVEAALADGAAHYGLNTGFGSLKSVRVDAGRLAALQHNLLRSHAVGVGEAVPESVSRRMLRLKVHALGLGLSGVSVPVFERLLALAERGLTPVVPAQGSLGASGDLAPLAHLALPLLGEGEIWEHGAPAPAEAVLREHGLAPVALGPKDGLALINGTQFMAAVASEALARALRLADTADVVAAMTLEGVRGSAAPFQARVHAVRPHAGAVTVAARVRALLAGSEIGPSHADCDRVQDPYSVRCVPQIHGASRDALAYALGQVETELNSVTDNPLVFGGDTLAEDGESSAAAGVVSAGNFHGQPLALALDVRPSPSAELASVSERRTYLLLDGIDRLPPYLVAETGVQSGFMMVQYTAAALVSENKTLCHPACVDSIPSSRGQEDHVSMGAWGARKALRVVENAERVSRPRRCARRRRSTSAGPCAPGAASRRPSRAVRARVPFRTADGLFHGRPRRRHRPRRLGRAGLLTSCASPSSSPSLARRLHPERHARRARSRGGCRRYGPDRRPARRPAHARLARLARGHVRGPLLGRLRAHGLCPLRRHDRGVVDRAGDDRDAARGRSDALSMRPAADIHARYTAAAGDAAGTFGHGVTVWARAARPRDAPPRRPRAGAGYGHLGAYTRAFAVDSVEALVRDTVVAGCPAPHSVRP